MFFPLANRFDSVVTVTCNLVHKITPGLIYFVISL